MVRVATWTPACVTAMGRAPDVLVYSTRASTVPCSAGSDRPNSVTSPYRPSNSPGTSAASSRAYASYVGVSSSDAKFTGSASPTAARTARSRRSEAMFPSQTPAARPRRC
ncbi:hypothetical protein GCM10010249_21820 [Streptomyces roseolilacinus]|uniref:Uncharacterized protein n=1 Tax=Streptomyces roseolilacinus TaxID=66904 RepID=A0A918EJ70_9ACTN|nr:hypothetical protein GCM10010249_21820 [Streptomyces roseolilacinus]